MTTTTPTSASGSAPVPRAVARDTDGLERVGGLAGFVIAVTYLIGMGLMGAYLVPQGFLDGQASPQDSLAFLLDHQVMLYVWYFVLYLVGGIALVSLVLGVHHRLRPGAAGLSHTAAVIGHLWAGLLLASGLVALAGQRAVVDLAATDPAMAASTWSSISVVQTALGGGPVGQGVESHVCAAARHVRRFSGDAALPARWLSGHWRSGTFEARFS